VCGNAVGATGFARGSRRTDYPVKGCSQLGFLFSDPDTGDLRHGRSGRDVGGSEAIGMPWEKEGGGFHTSASRPTKRSNGSTTDQRTREGTGESRGKGLTSNGEENTKCEQSWRLAIRGRFRANGYACCKSQPFQNLSRNLFPPRRFSPPGNSAAFNGTA
jgi:hypothetical protein